MIALLAVLASAGISVPALPVVLVMLLFVLFVLPADTRKRKPSWAPVILSGLFGAVLIGLGLAEGAGASGSSAVTAVALVSFFAPILGVALIILSCFLVKKKRDKEKARRILAETRNAAPQNGKNDEIVRIDEADKADNCDNGNCRE